MADKRQVRLVLHVRHHVLRCVMPTKQTRLTFTPDPATLAVIQRIVRVTRQPASSIVAESMGLLTEHLANLAEVLEHANTLSAEAKSVMAAAADSAADQVRPHVLEARRVMGELQRSIQDRIEGSEPPSSNTGVTLSDEPTLPLGRAAA